MKLIWVLFLLAKKACWAKKMMNFHGIYTQYIAKEDIFLLALVEFKILDEPN